MRWLQARARDDVTASADEAAAATRAAPTSAVDEAAGTTRAVPSSAVDEAAGTTRAAPTRAADAAAHPTKGTDETARTVRGVDEDANTSHVKTDDTETTSPSLDEDPRVLDNKNLHKAAVSVHLGENIHTLKPIRVDNQIQLWICSTCGSLRNRIDGVLAAMSAKGPTKSLYARLTKLREKVDVIEENINNGSIRFGQIPAEANQISSHLRDLAKKYPEFEYSLNFGKIERPGISDYEDLARRLGFERTNFRSHGQPVFRKGNSYITPDVDMHNGGIWKMADSVANLRNRHTRMGTYDEFLERIGD